MSNGLYLFAEDGYISEREGMSLETAIAYFEKNRDGFAKEHHGEIVLLYKEEVAGFYKNFSEAYAVAIKNKYPPGSFLLRACLRLEEETKPIFHSRVVG